MLRHGHFLTSTFVAFVLWKAIQLLLAGRRKNEIFTVGGSF
jgi:hypothetical protein